MAVALLIALYLRALKELGGLNSHLVCVLLDDRVRQANRAGVILWAKTATVKNADELGLKVHVALGENAIKYPARVREARELLWAARGSGSDAKST